MVVRTFWFTHGVSNAFLPETTNFNKRFPKLDCKCSVSYNDS